MPTLFNTQSPVTPEILQSFRLMVATTNRQLAGVADELAAAALAKAGQKRFDALFARQGSVTCLNTYQGGEYRLRGWA